MFRGTTFGYLGGATLTLFTLSALLDWTRSRADVDPGPRGVARGPSVPGTATAVHTIDGVIDDGVLIDRSAVVRSRGAQS